MFETFLLLLAVHFFADFVCQSDWMAINKSKNWLALTAHVSVYTLPFLFFMGWKFALITFMLHFVQDAITSRVSSFLWQANKRHDFFVCIGLDQLLHFYGLAITLRYLA